MKEGVLVTCHGFTVADERKYLIGDILCEGVEFGIGHEGEIVFLSKEGDTE